MASGHYLRGTSDGEISFPDLRTAYEPDIARNSNLSSIRAYSLFGRFLVTGLIGGFLITFFPIPGIRAGNKK